MGLEAGSGSGLGTGSRLVLGSTFRAGCGSNLEDIVDDLNAEGLDAKGIGSKGLQN